MCSALTLCFASIILTSPEKAVRWLLFIPISLWDHEAGILHKLLKSTQLDGLWKKRRYGRWDFEQGSLALDSGWNARCHKSQCYLMFTKWLPCTLPWLFRITDMPLNQKQDSSCPYQVAWVVKKTRLVMWQTWDTGSIPGSGRSLGGGHSKPLQYSCLENPMGRGAWQTTVYRVTKSCIWLKWISIHHT